MKDLLSSLLAKILLYLIGIIIFLPSYSFAAVHESTSSTGKVIFIDVEGVDVQHAEREGKMFSKVTLKGVEGFEGVHHRIGFPEIPVIRLYVTGTVEVEAIYPVSLTKQAPTFVPNTLIPVQPSTSKSFSKSLPFAINQAIYQEDSFYPVQNYDLTPSGSINGVQRKLLTIYPFKYNPKTNEYDLTRQFVVTIHEAQLPKQSQAQHVNEGIVFVVGEQFADSPALEEYLTFKAQEGFLVDTITFGEDVLTSEELRTNLHQTYLSFREANRILKYIILVGDQADVPAHAAPNIGEHPFSDHYYTTIDTDDFENDVFSPDVTIGRISAETEDQLATILEKYTTYQNGIFESEDWLKKASFLSTNDSSYWQMAENTNTYVIEHYTEPNTYIGHYPEETQAGGDQFFYRHRVTRDDLITAFDDGRAIINYTGHGTPHFWDYPNFRQNNVRNIDHPSALPFVFSFACLTGNFILDRYYGTRLEESLAETWQRHTQGAIMFWGAMSYSYWDEDDILQKELFKGIYDDGKSTFGEILNNGMTNMSTHYGNRGRSKYYWEIYHSFGDPSIRFRTQASIPIEVSGPEAWPLFQQELPEFVLRTETGEPVIGARVALVSRDGTFADYTFSDAEGSVVLSLPEEIEPNSILDITITGTNLRRHTQELQVLPSDQPHLRLHNYYVEEERETLVYVGEEFNLYFDVENIGLQETQGAVITVDQENIQGPITFLSGRVETGVLSHGIRLTIDENSFRFLVGEDAAPNQALTIPIKWETVEGYTGKSTAHLNVARASLEITQVDFGEEPGLLPGGSGNIYITVKNIGNEVLQNATLDPLATACIQEILGDATIDELAPNETLRLETPFEVVLESSEACPTQSSAIFEVSGSYENTVGIELGIAAQSSFEIGYMLETQHSHDDIHLNIPNANADGIYYEWEVDRVGSIEDIGFELGINHRYIGDLVVTLIHPDGTRVVLHNREGSSNNDINEIYGMDGNKLINLKDYFQGKPMEGTWKLHLQDLNWHWQGWIGYNDKGYLNDINLILKGYSE